MRPAKILVIDDEPHLVKLVRSLILQYSIPVENIRMHREFAPYKSCPGTKFPWDRFKGAL